MNPAGWGPAGFVVVLSSWSSVCRDLGDGGSGGGLVDDGLVGGERGDERVDGEVVDRPRVAAGGLVDQGGGVVAEQGVAAAGESEVVAQVAAGLLAVMPVMA